jgi:hypothetical protein
MFGNKLATSEAKITALLGIFAAVGYIPASAEEASVEGFTAHLAMREKNAVDAATAPHAVTLAAYADGFKAAGIALKAGDAITADAVKAAVDSAVAARASQKAVETVASSGHARALEVPKGAEASSDVEAMNAADLGAAVQAEKDPVKRKKLFVAYERRFLSGSR